MTLHNNSSSEIDIFIPLDDGPLPDPTPVKMPSGNYKVPFIQPNDDRRHVALGVFMDEWSKLEMKLSILLSAALSTRLKEMPVLMNALGNHGQRAVIDALLSPRLSKQAADELAPILERIKNNNTRRNHLVHGYWHLEIVVTDRNGVPHPSYRQYRRYDPSDPEIRRALDKREKSAARKNYMFSLPRILAIATELRRIREDLGEFISRNFQYADHKYVDAPIAQGAAGDGV